MDIEFVDILNLNYKKMNKLIENCKSSTADIKPGTDEDYCLVYTRSQICHYFTNSKKYKYSFYKPLEELIGGGIYDIALIVTNMSRKDFEMYNISEIFILFVNIDLQSLITKYEFCNYTVYDTVKRINLIIPLNIIFVISISMILHKNNHIVDKIEFGGDIIMLFTIMSIEAVSINVKSFNTLSKELNLELYNTRYSLYMNMGFQRRNNIIIFSFDDMYNIYISGNRHSHEYKMSYRKFEKDNTNFIKEFKIFSKKYLAK